MPQKTLANNRLSLNNKDDFQICTTINNYSLQRVRYRVKSCNADMFDARKVINLTAVRLLTFRA